MIFKIDNFFNAFSLDEENRILFHCGKVIEEFHMFEESEENYILKEKYKYITQEEKDNLILENSKGKTLYYDGIKIKAEFLPECPKDIVNGIFDFNLWTWKSNASLDEEIEYYKNLIIQKTREHELLKASDFTGTQEEINLKTEIENLKQIYMDKNHELALQIDNRLREV